MAGEVLILDYYGAALNIVCQQAGDGAPIPIGETTRAWAGNERTSSRGEKRTWNIRTTKLPKPMRQLIRQLIARRNQIYMAGEAITDNPVLDPLNLASTRWTFGSGGGTVTPGVLDPFGTLYAQTFTPTSGHDLRYQALPPSVSIVRTNSLWLRRRTGSGVIQLIRADGAGVNRSAALPVTSQWQQYTTTGPADVSRYIGIDVQIAGEQVDVYGADMTGDPILCSAICNSADMQEGTYLWEMSLTIFEV